MVCIYNRDGKCTNLNCVVYTCPIVGNEELCKHFEEYEENFVLTPKGCLIAALSNHIQLDEDIIDLIWKDFADSMQRNGYVEEDE